MSPLVTGVVAAGEEQMLGRLHRATGGSAPMAALLVSGFGWPATTAYRPMYVWAERLARSGIPTARYDLPGTGDSAGSPRDPGRIGAWIASVGLMGDWVREQTGAERLAVVGVGLGGLLAWAALGQGLRADALMLWGVPASGRAMLRELQAQAAVIAARHPGDRELPAEGVLDGDMQLVGFRLSGEDAEALRELRPQVPAERLPARVLLVGRDALRVPNTQSEQFAATELEVAESGDFEMLLADPQESCVPTATIDRSLAWLAPAGQGAGTGPPRQPPQRAAPVMTLTIDGRTVTEQAVQLEVDGHRLFGVVTRPAEGAPRAELAAVFLGAGALHHVGPNRAWVEAARRWAALGVSSLRIDQPGVGDAEGEAAVLVPNRALYTEAAIARVQTIVERLPEHGLAEQAVLVGLCSGAYWGLHVALADRRVAGVLMINLYALHWSPALVAERETQKTLSSLQGRSWRRLARGDVTAQDVLERVRTLAPGRLRERMARPQETAQRASLEAALDVLRERGTVATFLLSRDEPLLGQLERQGFLADLDRWPTVQVQTIPSRDHMFRGLALQQDVHRCLDDGLRRALKLEA